MELKKKKKGMSRALLYSYQSFVLKKVCNEAKAPCWHTQLQTMSRESDQEVVHIYLVHTCSTQQEAVAFTRVWNAPYGVVGGCRLLCHDDVNATCIWTYPQQQQTCGRAICGKADKSMKLLHTAQEDICSVVDPCPAPA